MSTTEILPGFVGPYVAKPNGGFWKVIDSDGHCVVDQFWEPAAQALARILNSHGELADACETVCEKCEQRWTGVRLDGSPGDDTDPYEVTLSADEVAKASAALKLARGEA